MTLDLPSLQCWLRARVGGQWQPPTLARIQPLPRADSQRVAALMQKVFANHPQDYLPLDGWQEKASRVLQNMMAPPLASLLDEFLSARLNRQEAGVSQPVTADDPLHLGF